MLLVNIFSSDFDPHKNSNPIYEAKDRVLLYSRKIRCKERLATLEQVHKDVSGCLAYLDLSAFSKTELINLKKNVVILNSKFDKHNQKLVQIHWLCRWILSRLGVERLSNLPTTQIEDALKAKGGLLPAPAQPKPAAAPAVKCLSVTPNLVFNALVKQSDPSCRNLLDLPVDILRLIFQKHLPFVAVKPARFVCRRFKQLIPRPPTEYGSRYDGTPVVRFAHECARLGYLKVLQWAYKNKCPILGINQEAARSGHLDVIQWGYQNGQKIDSLVHDLAAENGHWRVLEWSIPHHNSPGTVSQDICTHAARGGQFGILQWAQARGYPMNWRTCQVAAKRGDLEMLKWLRSKSCDWDANTCHIAAKYGYLNILEFARANGCPWNQTTCSIAVEGKRLEVLQWLRLHKCPWDEKTCEVAAKLGYLEILQWAIENGCPYDKKNCYFLAIGESLSRWLPEMDPTDLMLQFQRENKQIVHPHIIEWLDSLPEGFQRRRPS